MQNEENTYPSPFTSFILRLASLLLLIVVTLALIAAWHTFLLAAPIIIQVLILLLLLLIVGALCYLAIDKYMDIRSKHLAERRRNEHHAVQLHMMQSRIHADERGNKPSLITASGAVVNLPSGNYVQPVSTTYSPHITYAASPKGPGTTIQEVPNVQASLPAPTVPSFSQLLHRGLVVPGEPQSILGYTDGVARRGEWAQLHSFFVVGISGSGKSSTVAYYTALAVMHGARLLVIDPDMEEEQSISQRIAPLSFALLTPVVSTPQGVGRVLDIASREIAAPSPFPVVFIVDEFSTIMRSPEWASMAPALATGLEDYAQRGRKRGRTAIVIGQISKASRTGGTELRESMTATFIHRTKASQARMVIDADTAKDAPHLAVGECMVQLANSAEPYRMSIPEATHGDMEQVAQLMLPRRNSRVLPTTESFRRVSNAFQNSNVSEVETRLKRLETLRFRVSALLETGKTKRDIILEIWGAVPGGNRAYQDASKQYDAIIAELSEEQEEQKEEQDA